MHYLNGKWVKDADLTLSAFDLSVIRGFGVFDFLRTYGRKPFYLNEHIDRLFTSASYLGIVVPKSMKEIASIVENGIERSDYEDFNIRIVVTGGVGPDGVTPGKPSLIVMFTKAHDYPQSYYTKGVSIITYPHVRAFPHAKSLNYLTGIVALQEARKRNAVEAVYTDQRGAILEGTTSNFFAVTDGGLVTPKNSILIGVTRDIVLNLAKNMGLRVQERLVNMSEKESFYEAFITASNKEVMPVVQIDDKRIGKGVVGPVSKKLITQYKKMISDLEDG